MTALFERVGEAAWIPTELCRGPWDPDACHGGPVAALLARMVEHADADERDDPHAATAADRWQIARLTVELTRPVPVGRPLRASTHVERPGRKVSLVAGVLSDGDVEVARVRALRIRHERFDLPEATVQPAADPPGAPDGAEVQLVSWAASDLPAFHTHACEHRFSEGAWERPGPVGVWIRLRVPVVDGESPTGVQRVAAAADFGNGVSAGLPYDQFVFINPDLTIHLLRPPSGEWVGMRTASYYGVDAVTSGAGMAESELYDERGRLGRSVQSLFVAAR